MNVTIFTKNKDNFSKNGAFSQIIFVYYCLNQIKNINCKVFTNNGIPIYKDIVTYNDSNEFFKQDIIICLNAFILEESILKKIKMNNIKLFFYNCGNFYYVFQEDILFNHHHFIKKNNIKMFKYYDKLIHIPNYNQYQDYYRSIFNIQDIDVAPYVWYNNLIDDYMKNHDISLFYDSRFNKSKTKYILICEPNLQLTKTCLVPLLICNELYKSNFQNIKVLCLCKPKYLENLLKLTQHLEIFKNNLVEFYNRIGYYDLIKDLKLKNLDFCLLSHQKDNPLNFIHLETLYLKYGLIHNTPNYNKAGYYYKSIPEAVKQLKYCFKDHSKNLKKYNYQTRKILDKFSPYNKKNQIIYNNYINVNNKSNFINLKSFAQINQDIKVLEYYKYKKNGYFIDIGANDGITINNTYLLEKEFNWNGICIEPLPEQYKKLNQNRSCLCLNKAIYSESNKLLDFIDTSLNSPDKNGFYSGILNNYNKDLQKKHFKNCKIIKVNTINFEDLKNIYNIPEFVDYLSVDTEGSEYEIIKTINFEKIKFGIIHIEHNYETEKRENIKKLLLDNNYKYYQENKWDDIYIYNNC